jgi:hypothetical protein
MATTIDEILSELAERSPAGSEHVVQLLTGQPERASELVTESARRLVPGSEPIDAAFAFVPEDRLQIVADESVSALVDGMDADDSQAAHLIALLSLQAPGTLRPHLDALWELRPNTHAYYAEWPWRGAEPGDDIDKLRVRLGTGDPESRDRAFWCLLESRTTEGWQAASDAIQSTLGRSAIDERFLYVGIELRRGDRRRLCSDPPSHLVFAEGVLPPFRWLGFQAGIHDPTWTPEGELAARGVFGGSIDEPCKVCGRPLDRLVTVRGSSPISGPSEVITCRSCLMSEPVLFFLHEHGGVRPTGPDVEKRDPEFPVDPFPDVPVVFVETPPRWQLQDWALSNGRENLNRLGGEPTWIQGPDFPACPDCGERMIFSMQLDSLEVERTSGGQWGTGGILYAFWCPRDGISATLCQFA